MRIYFASRKKMLVEAITALLAGYSEFIVCNVLDTLEEIEKLRDMGPGDVIILTEPAFDFSTVCVLQKLHFLRKGIPVVLVSCKEHIESASFLFQYSVKAILTKESHVTELHTALRMASMGKPYLTATIAQSLADDLYYKRPALKLSPREMEVIGFIAKGDTTSEIAKRLSLSAKTVSAHKSSIKIRLNLGSTSEMVQYAIEHNLISL